MGMFDDILVRYPLPDWDAEDRKRGEEWIARSKVFSPLEPNEIVVYSQTKNLDCFMDTYEVRRDGTLWKLFYEFTDGEIGERERKNERLEFQGEFIGEICFAGYSGYFVDGKLNQLHKLK